MEIKLDASTIRNEVQEKLKKLKKYELSEEFSIIKVYCNQEVEKLEKKIRKVIKDRKTKKEKHPEIYSDLDFMLLDQEYMQDIMKIAKDQTFVNELKDGIEIIDSHLFLKGDANFDICIHSELSYLKRKYKLYLGIEHTIKQMITNCELQEKEIDLEASTNAYHIKPQSSGQINMEG